MKMILFIPWQPQHWSRALHTHSGESHIRHRSSYLFKSQLRKPGFISDLGSRLQVWSSCHVFMECQAEEIKILLSFVVLNDGLFISLQKSVVLSHLVSFAFDQYWFSRLFISYHTECLGIIQSSIGISKVIIMIRLSIHDQMQKYSPLSIHYNSRAATSLKVNIPS